MIPPTAEDKESLDLPADTSPSTGVFEATTKVSAVLARKKQAVSVAPLCHLGGLVAPLLI